MNEYYVYEHLTLDDDRFCVGKGKKFRCKDGAAGRNDEWHEKAKHGFKWNIIADNLTSDEAHELEKLIIETIGYENLVNKVPGRKNGTKVENPARGYKRPDAVSYTHLTLPTIYSV